MNAPLNQDQQAAVSAGLNKAAELIEEARLVAAFDSVFAIKGVAGCLRVITILSERLAQLIHASLGGRP